MSIKLFLLLCALPAFSLQGQQAKRAFRVLALHTAKQDEAHISFVKEANRWFAANARAHGFDYTSSDQWDKLNDDTLSTYDVVIFPDTRPGASEQRA